MRFSHQQLTLWYGTPDAPAPIDSVLSAGQPALITVAVQPPGPSNSVTVHYRIDGGATQYAPAVRQSSDLQQGVEYYRAQLTNLKAGSHVSYLPVLRCAGRCAPDAATTLTFASSFRVAGVATPNSTVPVSTGAAQATTRRTPPDLQYLASIRVPLNEPEVIGVTPEGLLVNWYWSPHEGAVLGMEKRAKVRQIGGDWMTIRRDGIGLMDVRATVEIEDGALLYASYQGYCDFGQDGYQRFLDRRWPEVAPTRTAPRIRTAHPHYAWFNRLQCVGIGEVHMQQLVYAYDLYALRWPVR
ncbi:MAG TPA: DUF3237 domain-containing protein [Polyangiaceae bacterium]|nr:DUF3237 domain-containing protein [Polyangiaceae bacterium]